MRPRILMYYPCRIFTAPYRWYSSLGSEGPSYDSKVYALPFQTSLSMAREVIQIAAEERLNTVDNAFKSLRENMEITSGDNCFVNDWTFKLRTVRAFYLPTWYTWAALRLKMSIGTEEEFSQGEREEVDAYVRVLLPGHSREPLCRLFLPNLPKKLWPVPFSQSLLRTKWGDPVIALPFSISPFRIPKLEPSTEWEHVSGAEFNLYVS
ncbi:hypothetical protein DACRYDRAFT_23760, partial [Dacryopinax primogenitus]